MSELVHFFMAALVPCLLVFLVGLCARREQLAALSMSAAYICLIVGGSLALLDAILNGAKPL